MNLFGHELEGFAKALVVLSVVLLVSSGLCGLQFVVSQGGEGTILIPLGIIELIAIFVSAAGIVLVLIAWGIRALFGRSED